MWPSFCGVCLGPVRGAFPPGQALVGCLWLWGPGGASCRRCAPQAALCLWCPALRACPPLRHRLRQPGARGWRGEGGKDPQKAHTQRRSSITPVFWKHAFESHRWRIAVSWDWIPGARGRLWVVGQRTRAGGMVAEGTCGGAVFRTSRGESAGPSAGFSKKTRRGPDPGSVAGSR